MTFSNIDLIKIEHSATAKTNTNHTWLGGKMDRPGGKFRWLSDNSEVEGWQPGERDLPNSHPTALGCVNLNLNGTVGVGDIPCESTNGKLAPFCQLIPGNDHLIAYIFTN